MGSLGSQGCGKRRSTFRRSARVRLRGGSEPDLQLGIVVSHRIASQRLAAVPGPSRPVNAGKIALTELYPDWAAGLSFGDREAVRETVLLPVVRVDPGPCDGAAWAESAETRALLGGVVIEGLLIAEMWLAGQAAAQIYGPGDALRLEHEPHGSLATEHALHTPVPTSLALLDHRFLASLGRWPRLSAGFFTQAMRQVERAREHQVISQLTRVEDRLLALFWHLAERSGRVRKDGVTIDLPLTHETIGRMVGARRPTVTLGLRELARRGLLRREDHLWLLATDSHQRLRPARRGQAPLPVNSLHL